MNLLAPVAFSPATRAALRKADQRLRSAPRGNQYERYSACRTAMNTMWDVDQFHVALYRDRQTVVRPYSVVAGRFLPPEVEHIGARGLAAWLLASRRTYRWSDDDGQLLRRTILTERDALVRDAVVVPFFDGADAQPAGYLSHLSQTARCFSDEAVAAAEWLAKALSNSMRRDVSDVTDISLYDIYPDLDSSNPTTVDDVAQSFALKLSGIAQVLDTLPTAVESGRTDEASHRARVALALCQQAQVEIAQMVINAAPELPGRLHLLTEREREIALLIAQDECSNAQIAERLSLSEKTVKGHVSHILHKLDIKQRSAISWALHGR